jgi:hypothetical protein
MADFKLTLEEVCYESLKRKLIELGEEDFVEDTEKNEYDEYLKLYDGE